MPTLNVSLSARVTNNDQNFPARKLASVTLRKVGNIIAKVAKYQKDSNVEIDLHRRWTFDEVQTFLTGFADYLSKLESRQFQERRQLQRKTLEPNTILTYLTRTILAVRVQIGNNLTRANSVAHPSSRRLGRQPPEVLACKDSRCLRRTPE